MTQLALLTASERFLLSVSLNHGVLFSFSAALFYLDFDTVYSTDCKLCFHVDNIPHGSLEQGEKSSARAPLALADYREYNQVPV
jgi:hypothetical protein